jgi:hypothetical protein
MASARREAKLVGVDVVDAAGGRFAGDEVLQELHGEHQPLGAAREKVEILHGFECGREPPIVIAGGLERVA